MEGCQDLDGGREAEEGDGDAGGAPVLGRDRARGAWAQGRHRERTPPNAGLTFNINQLRWLLKKARLFLKKQKIIFIYKTVLVFETVALILICWNWAQMEHARRLEGFMPYEVLTEEDKEILAQENLTRLYRKKPDFPWMTSQPFNLWHRQKCHIIISSAQLKNRTDLSAVCRRTLGVILGLKSVARWKTFFSSHFFLVL